MHPAPFKIGLVCSSGGHLAQLIPLRKWWQHYERFWVTFNKTDANSLLEGERVYYAYYPTNRSIFNLIRNFFVALKVLWKERPNLLISTGAAVAVPCFYVGKLLGAKLVYVEVFDHIDAPTLTGRLVYPIVDKFLVQWEEQKRFYPKAEFRGQTL